MARLAREHIVTPQGGFFHVFNRPFRQPRVRRKFIRWLRYCLRAAYPSRVIPCCGAPRDHPRPVSRYRLAGLPHSMYGAPGCVTGRRSHSRRRVRVHHPKSIAL